MAHIHKEGLSFKLQGKDRFNSMQSGRVWESELCTFVFLFTEIAHSLLQ